MKVAGKQSECFTKTTNCEMLFEDKSSVVELITRSGKDDFHAMHGECTKRPSDKRQDQKERWKSLATDS